MSYSIGKILEIASLLGCVSSSIYYLLCLWSAGRFLQRRKAPALRNRSCRRSPFLSHSKASTLKSARAFAATVCRTIPGTKLSSV